MISYVLTKQQTPYKQTFETDDKIQSLSIILTDNHQTEWIG